MEVKGNGQASHLVQAWVGVGGRAGCFGTVDPGGCGDSGEGLLLRVEAEYRDRKPWPPGALQGWENKGRSTAQSREHWRPDSSPGTADRDLSGPTGTRCGQSGCERGVGPLAGTVM